MQPLAESPGLFLLVDIREELFASATYESDSVPAQGSGQTPKLQVFGRLSNLGCSGICRHDETSRAIQSLQDQAAAEQFVTLTVTFLRRLYGNIAGECAGRIAVSIFSRSSCAAADPFKQMN